MDKAGLLAQLRERIVGVEERLAAACQCARRSRAEVTVVAVTKTVPVEIAALLPELGMYHLGENRPQELWRKAAALPPTVRWHLIGHLQRNKIEPTLPRVSMIHSVDSLRLLQALDRTAKEQQRTVDVLLEVNTSGEASKHGFAPRDLPALTPEAAGLGNLHIRGLMTMAPLQTPEACRPYFATLRQLGEQAFAMLHRDERLELSMGMSNDFEVAVEEGATLVRLGSVLFEGLSA